MHQTTVVSKVKTYTNGSRAPVVWGKLDCGHTCEIPLRPVEIECRKCGHVGPFVDPTDIEVAASGVRIKVCSSCRSSSGGRYAVTPDAHNDDHHMVQVGDEVECRHCADHATALAKLEDVLTDPEITVAYTRFRQGRIRVYARDSQSPTGVRLVMSINNGPCVAVLLRDARVSTLSPTERA